MLQRNENQDDTPMNVQIEQLSKDYGRFRALADVSLSISAGMFGLLGPNGAGKTTLMRILATLLPPTSGRVQVGPFDLLRQPQEIRQRLGYIPQSFGFYKNLTALEMLEYIAEMKNLPASRRKAAIDAALTQVNLTEAAHRRVGTFSGGMIQRLGIAQALLGDPQLIVVDEPTAGLDPEERVRFRNLFAGLAEQRTVVLSTHIVADIEASCTALAVLYRGRVIYTGQPADMARRAVGQVWSFQIPVGELSAAEQRCQVISTRSLGSQLALRALAAEAPAPGAEPVEAGLEDGYLALLAAERGETRAADRLEVRHAEP
jgi:ABC-type multidrug transport system ATPase subunit